MSGFRILPQSLENHVETDMENSMEARAAYTCTYMFVCNIWRILADKIRGKRQEHENYYLTVYAGVSTKGQ